MLFEEGYLIIDDLFVEGFATGAVLLLLQLLLDESCTLLVSATE